MRMDLNSKVKAKKSLMPLKAQGFDTDGNALLFLIFSAPIGGSGDREDSGEFFF
ncbi:hypothetical protein [Rubritalea tangerina]|uniref:hypothetical protein n=1 Tax=Rubritalea tangerina TaxID=430798 RepID=UPI0036062965